MAKVSTPKKAVKGASKVTASKENKVAIPQSFTVNSMANYLAETKGISKKDAKEILDIIIDLIEAGVLQGNRVPLGKIGKVYAKKNKNISNIRPSKP